MHSILTQLVEVCVTAIRSWYRANQTGLEECCPLVNQTSLTAHVILNQDVTVIQQEIRLQFVFDLSYLQFDHLTR